MSGKRVLAAGKFDILHLGHLAYLEQAKEIAGEDGELIVVIALDKTVQRERGAPPVFPQEQRRRLVESLAVVDKAVLGYDTSDHTIIVTDIKPDIVALGYDQKTDIPSLEKHFQEMSMTTEIVRLQQRKADGLYSSTLIRERIIEFYRENGRARI
ncbi:MAG: adenylyltransferase/cytidyltransferase family protein [Candidatus Thorarchaeota archaeon]